MNNPSDGSFPRTTQDKKTYFHIRMYEVLFISATFSFIYSLYHSGLVLWVISFSTIYFTYRKLIAHNTEMLPTDDKAVFITGCDSGFGFDLAKSLLAQNFQVFAGCLNPDSGEALELHNYSLDSSKLSLMKLDITDEQSIKQCVNIVHDFCCEKGLWALVNNAGIDKFGSVEFTTMDIYKDVMNANYFGTVCMTKEFLPLIRKAKGRILNITSCAGKLALPNRAAYCPSKFAVEAFSDILRLEVQPFGINVSIIEPGPYDGTTKIPDTQLNILEASLEKMWESTSEDVRTTYGKMYLYHLRKNVEEEIANNSKTSRPLIEAMTHAIQSTAPKYRYLIKGGQQFMNLDTALVYAVGVLPEPIMDFILKKIYLTNWPIPQSLQQN